MWIRNNQVGPGRLLFVAGHGAGDVSDIYIQNNVLTGKNMGVDFVAPGRHTRQNIVVTGNVSDTAVGNGRGAVCASSGTTTSTCATTVQPTQTDRDMYMVGYHALVQGHGLGQRHPQRRGPARRARGTARRLREHASARRPRSGRRMFEGQNLKIDVGGDGGGGVIPCPTTNNCGGFYSGGAATVLTAASGGTLAERTMLQGDLQFDIPIRSGTYDVTLTWIEPTADISDRRFHSTVTTVFGSSRASTSTARPAA